MINATVSAGYTRALLSYAVSRGADRAKLIERSGIRPGDLDDSDNRVPFANSMALMKAAVYLCNDPAFALRFGEAVRTEDLSVAMLIAGNSKTVEECRVRMNRYARLIRDDNAERGSDLLELVRDRRGVWLELTSPAQIDAPYFVEAGFAWCVRETRKMLAAHQGGHPGGHPFPRAIHFTHDEPGYRAEYDRVFGVPLVFGSDRNALLIDGDFLSVTLPASNPYLVRVLSNHAETLLNRLQNSKTIRSRVESLLIPGLHTGDARIAAIAGKMGMSRQTLFRRLKAEGTTFEKVLDDLRHKLALHYLSEKNVPVNEAAWLVGFSEPAAFSRAYKRWTGNSPRTARPH
jgi:AraC-like DNA-binding protein